MTHPHKSVLLKEVLAAFENTPLKVFVDGTLGAGGHSAAILEQYPEIEHFYGIDQDPDAMKIAKERLSPWKGKTHFIAANFSQLDRHINKPIDGILIDLGVSSMQLDRPEKGFSFSKDGPLDMRMDPKGETTAADIINEWSERDLGILFRKYGEEKRWRAAARAICQARIEKPIETTRQLVNTLLPVLFFKKKGIHPLTLIFQAIRIAVNKELQVIEEVIPKAIKMLRPGGVMAIISFHSLEDRIVKNAFRYAASDTEDTSGRAGDFINKDPQVTILTRKPIIPSDEEISANPRSRSAKMRIIIKK